MGLNDFILNCERDNKELRKDIEYYKNKNQRLQQENQELKNQQKEFIKQLEKLAHQDMVYSDFANGCKVAYGIALNKYKEIVGINGD